VHVDPATGERGAREHERQRREEPEQLHAATR
jgi:hypothetical protein